MFIKISDEKVQHSFMYEASGEIAVYEYYGVVASLEGWIGVPRIVTDKSDFDIDGDKIRNLTNCLIPQTPIYESGTNIKYTLENIRNKDFDFEELLQISFTCKNGEIKVLDCYPSTVYILNDNGKTIDKY